MSMVNQALMQNPAPALPRQDSLSALRRLTLTSLLLALYLAVDAIPSPVLPPPFMGFFKFTAFPSMLAGLLVGPAAGATVGALGDLLHYALHPSGAYFPGFALTGALTGALPALLLRHRQPRFLSLLVAIGITQIITKLVLVPACLAYFFGRPWQLQLVSALIKETIHVPIYAYTINLILGQWRQYLKHRGP